MGRQSLSEGTSPSINLRVTPGRKAQLKALAELEGEKDVSNLVRRLIDEYVSGLHSASVHGNSCPMDDSPLNRSEDGSWAWCEEAGHKHVWDGKTVAMKALRNV